MGLQDGRTKTLNEAPLQPHKDFDMITLASTTPNKAAETSWVESEDGHVVINAAGVLLRDVRPNHYRMYLLRRDRYGLLAARGEEHTFPSPPEIAPNDTLAAGIEWPNVHRPWQSPKSPLATLPSSKRVEVQDHSNFDDLSNHPSNQGQEASLDSTSQNQSEQSQIPDPDFAAMNNSATATTDLEVHVDTDWNDDLLEGECMMPEFSPGLQDGLSNICELFEGWPLNLGQITAEHTNQTSTSQSALSGGFLQPSPDLFALSFSAYSLETSSARNLRPNSLPMASHELSTLKESLQSRYDNLVTSYTKTVSEEAQQAQAGIQRKLRAQWITPATRWASVWTQPDSRLPRGGAPSAAEADVLYLTSDEIISFAQSSDIFCKPIVIKQSFADSGMHSVQEFKLLCQAATNAILETHSLDSTLPGSGPLPSTLNSLRTNIDSTEGITVVLRNITRSHRPLVVMLPRFRLLDSLVDRAQGIDISDESNSIPDIAGHISFNHLTSTGAFSGTRLAIASGVWMRNLDGVKFCTLVSVSEANGETWKILADNGRDWVPNGEQKLIVLEQDDMLFIPPGLRIAYGMHSPTDGLIEGGNFWDSLNILGILHSANWMSEHQVDKDAPLGTQLPHLITELALLVKEQEDQFLGCQSAEDFNLAFERAVSYFTHMNSGSPVQ